MTDPKAKIIGRIQPGPLKTRLVIQQGEGALTIALDGDVAAPTEKSDNADARPAPTKKP